MKITNQYSLPQPFVDAVSIDDYDKGKSDYTTTGLLRPPRLAALERQHWQEMEEDVLDRLWRFSGQTKHVVLERMSRRDPVRYTVEKRFFATITGKVVSGQIDLYDIQEQILYDWKEVSVWKAIFGDQKEWEAQGNMNCYLMGPGIWSVKRIVFIAFFKDWKRRQAEAESDYPQKPVQTFEMPLWEPEKTHAFICERIRLHEAARIQLPECTAEERWSKPEQWAVKKRGNKRATALFDSEQEAEKFCKAQLPTYHIEYRPTEWTRCEHYCSAAPFCQQFQERHTQTLKDSIEHETRKEIQSQ